MSNENDNGDDTKAAQDAAREYAWNWFVYHANQRLIIFRFYLIMAAVIFSGFVATVMKDKYLIAFAFTVFLIPITLSFWRLDWRNKQLVKIAENFLKQEEGRLSKVLNTPLIKLAEIAENKPKYLSSFSQIYNLLFVLIILASLGVGAWSITQSFKTPAIPAEPGKVEEQTQAQ